MEQINHANGEAAAMVAVAEARAEGLNIVSKSLMLQEGKNAASLFIAEEYVHAFNKLARTNNTLILPSNVGDVTSLVGHAMSIYKAVSSHNNNDNNFPADKQQLPVSHIETLVSELKVSQPNVIPEKEHQANRRMDATLINNEQLNIDFSKDSKWDEIAWRGRMVYVESKRIVRSLNKYPDSKVT